MEGSDLHKTAFWFGVIGVWAGASLFFNTTTPPNIRLGVVGITVVGCFGSLIMEFIDNKIRNKGK